MDQPPTNRPKTEGHGVLVSVDVAHVGALWSRDPELSWEALNQLDGLIETMSEDMGGDILDTPGDAFIVCFPSAAPAVMWCARMQEGLLALDWPATLSANFDSSGAPDMLFGGLLTRMAIHDGSLETLRGLVTLTSPGQVLITQQTWESVTDPVPPDLQITELGSARCAGQVMTICQVTTRLLSKRRFAPLPKQSSRLPFEPDCFVGHLAALGDLRERLEAGTRLINITGAEGSGKTRLAMQWARSTESSGAAGVALVRLAGARDETDLQLATADALELSLSSDQAGSLAERVGHAMSARGPIVVLFDDFPADLSVTALATWLRAAPEARLLVTTDSPIESALATHQHLDPMHETDARALFLARTHRKLRGTDRPTHAAAITLPSTLASAIPSEVERLTGAESQREHHAHVTPMTLRHTALDSDQPPDERVEAGIESVSALCQMGMSDVALAVLATVEPILKDVSSPELTHRWTATQADVLIAAGRWAEAREIIATVQDRASSSDWLLRQAKLALAESRFSDAVDILAPVSDEHDSPEVALAYGLALHGADDWEDAAAHLKFAAVKLSQPLDQARAWAALGRLHGDLGQSTAAESALAQALKAGGDNPHLVASVHHHRFEAASARLALDEASTHIERATEVLLQCGDRAGAAQSLIHAGTLLLVRHDSDSAKTQFELARSISREDGLTLLEARALLGLGISARVAGDLGTALDSFAEAASLSEGQPELAGLIHAHRGAAEAACDAIDNAQAAFALSESHLESAWDVLGNTIHDVLTGFVDLAQARDAALEENSEKVDHFVDMALNRLARASSFETRSTPPRGREEPSRINALRLARLLLDHALGSTAHSSS